MLCMQILAYPVISCPKTHEVICLVAEFIGNDLVCVYSTKEI